ncbi:hypothetical protein VTL71DRAFT_2024 [Oculimacula yallundae]|uniref:DUF218 domain-containing protein n=1 Tax=Oculimacula yallundae TaxID=86028 RepID=A0ABR4CCC3_9HELO
MSLNATDINMVAKFLAHSQVDSLFLGERVDCVVICASAVLHQASELFRALEFRPDLTKTLVLCGGIGHSTPLIYDAVSKSPIYHKLANDIRGKPEARVLEIILRKHFDVEKITSRGCRILVEDQSTNCGANAARTRELLEEEKLPIPKTMILVQDPTMALRSVASFEKVYEKENGEAGLAVKSAPIFVPRMKNDGGKISWDVECVEAEELWNVSRFYDLVIGEIPRLRDDDDGYGPKGKGFIVHVDVPAKIEEAWRRLKEEFGGCR